MGSPAPYPYEGHMCVCVHQQGQMARQHTAQAFCIQECTVPGAAHTYDHASTRRTGPHQEETIHVSTGRMFSMHSTAHAYAQGVSKPKPARGAGTSTPARVARTTSTPARGARTHTHILTSTSQHEAHAQNQCQHEAHAHTRTYSRSTFPRKHNERPQKPRSKHQIHAIALANMGKLNNK